MGELFVYTLVFISIIDGQTTPDQVHVLTWVVSLILELIITGTSFALFSSPHREPKAYDPNGGQYRKGITTWEILQLLLSSLRILSLVLLLLFYFLSVLLRHRGMQQHHEPRNGLVDERSSLLTSQNGVNGQIANQTKPMEVAGWVRPDKIPTKSWYQYIKGYSLLFQYLWPSRSRRLQFTTLLCIGLLLIGRAVNVLVPYQFGRVTDLLTKEERPRPPIPWVDIFILVLLRSLQGSSGVLTSVRTALWIPINQYSYRELSAAIFEHVHILSLDFHLGKKTGEVISAMNKANSINTFLECITFQIVPMIVDLGVALVYFLHEFDIYYALIVATTSVVYMYLTMRMAQWRANVKREVTTLGRDEDAIKYVEDHSLVLKDY